MDHLSEILTTLADHQVNFIVGGGVAAVLHGVERVTMDLDIAIDWDHDNVVRFLDAMNVLHLRPRIPVPPEVLLDPAALEEMLKQKGALVFTFHDINNPIRLVDVFIRRDLSFSELSPGAAVIKIEGRTLRIVSHQKLLAIKQAIRPPRPKDELDISYLKALQERDEKA